MERNKVNTQIMAKKTDEVDVSSLIEQPIESDHVEVSSLIEDPSSKKKAPTTPANGDSGLGLDAGTSGSETGGSEPAVSTLTEPQPENINPYTLKDYHPIKSKIEGVKSVLNSYREGAPILPSLGRAMTPEEQNKLDSDFESLKNFVGDSQGATAKIKQGVWATNKVLGEAIDEVLKFPGRFVDQTKDLFSKGVKAIDESIQSTAIPTLDAEHIAKLSPEIQRLGKLNAVDKSAHALSGAAKIVFGALNVVEAPAMMAFSGATESAGKLIGEDAVNKVMAPVTSALGIDENSSELAKLAGSIGDLVVVGAVLHSANKGLGAKKISDAAERFKQNKATEEDLHTLHDFIAENPETINEASKNVVEGNHKKQLDEIPQPILDLGKQHEAILADAANQTGLAKEVLEKKAAEIAEKHNAGMKSHVENQNTKDNILALEKSKEGLSKDSQDVIDEKIQELQKELPQPTEDNTVMPETDKEGKTIKPIQDESESKNNAEENSEGIQEPIGESETGSNQEKELLKVGGEQQQAPEIKSEDVVSPSESENNTLPKEPILPIEEANTGTAVSSKKKASPKKKDNADLGLPKTIQEAQTMYAKKEIGLPELQKHLERIRKTISHETTQKFYQDANGMGKDGRIPVSPIEPTSPKKISDIVLDVTNDTKQRLLYSKTGRSLGSYSPGNSAIKIRYSGDLDTTAHEVGHSVDDLFGVLDNPPSSLDSELSKFWDYGSKPPASLDPVKALSYKRSEGFAEWLRAFMVNPEEAKTSAPELFKLYDSKVDDQYKGALNKFSTDIREFAGSTGRDMTLANIEFEPKKADGIIKEILSKKDSGNEFSISFADKLNANFVNPLNAFNKAFEYAKGIKGIDEVLPEDNPEILSRLLLGFDGKYGEMLDQGMVDSENRILNDAKGNPKNLNWLLEPLNATDKTTIENDMKDVVAYMVSERTVELAKKFGRENVLTGIGGGIFKDMDVAQKTLNEFKNGDSEKFTRIQEAAKRYREFSDDILKYMVDKGRMSEKQYKQIKDDNLQYVALNRVMETEPGREIEPMFGGSNKIGSKSDPVMKITGSTKQIVNPYSSLINTLYKAVRESDRNEVLKSFRDIIYEPRNMHENNPKRFSDIGIIGKEGDKNSITIFVDGKPEQWIFQEDIYKALKGLDSEAYKLPSIITALPKVLRWTVTNFPTFALRNIARDFQDRIIKTEDNSGFKDLFGDKKHWHDVAVNGGLNSGYYFRDRASYYGLLDEAMNDLSKNKKTIILDPKRLKGAFEGYKNLLQKSETVNRVAEYRAAFRKAKTKGMDDYNASLYGAFKSRDLMDFQLMGNYMKIINQLVPFSNASVQGLRKAVVSAKNNPSGFATRMFLTTVVPSTALWLLNHKDDETAKEYEALPAYQRDMAWNFKIGPNTWASIPKPYELSLLGAGTDRTMSAATGNEKSFTGYGGSIAKAFSPVDEGNFAGPFQGIVEGLTNHDFFRDKYIVPPHENALDLSLRNTERASRFGKALQEVSGMDARKIDHFVKSQFSYFGNAALKTSNIGREDGDKFNIGDLGFFKQTPAYNSQPVQDFMKYAEKWGLTSSKQYKEFGKLAANYFNAENDIGKDATAGILVDYAKSVLRDWERSNKKKELKPKGGTPNASQDRSSGITTTPIK